MNKTVVLTLLMALSTTLCLAQSRYFTRTGTISFFSKAALEDIEAKNRTATAVLDSKTGAFQFSVQMKAFEFEKELMQQHFNDSYAESDKYPKSEFKGTITNNAAVNYARDGSYPVKVKGKLTIHGVTLDVQTTGTATVGGGKVTTTASFKILLSDYKVNIPAVTKDKISNSITISVDCKLEPLKQ